MESKRKVIAHVTDIERQGRKTESGFAYRAAGSAYIFDSYEDFENFRRGIALDNADPTKPIARIIDWWWWYD